MQRPVNALATWRRLNLWPRLAVIVTLGFLLLFGVFSLLALRAVRDSTNRTLKERLVIAQMAAGEENRLIERGFYELRKATQFATFDPTESSQAPEFHMLAHAYGRIGTLSLGVYYLDAKGRVVLSQPPGKLPTGASLAREPYVKRVLDTRRRSVSIPFRDPTTGQPTVALTIPIVNPSGSLRSLLVGLLDVSALDVLKPLEYARSLGHTGHAELVDQRGFVIASTDEPGEFMKPGEHRDFYVRMLKARTSGVETVLFVPWRPEPGHHAGERHVMAFAPLSAAPWGLAVGGSDRETFAPVTHLRNTLLLSGALALASLWVLTLFGARLLVRPVRILTERARGMAAGNLEQPVPSGGGGEVRVLGQSLEAMRAQLRESLATVRRWGEELELEVEKRTAELTTSNRQLAAVTAVATAANQALDLERMLGRCLEVVLEHTGMKAGAVRLLDDSGRLGIPVSRGDYDHVPCEDEAIGVRECSCGLVASTGTPLYLDPAARKGFRPPCRAPADQALTIVPLRGPKGTLGVLYLTRSGGDPPGPAERRTVEVICNQIAVAVENARLLEELRGLEAQREVQRLKAELISAVSHELRTPLGFIKGYATTLLREDVAPIDASTRREFLEIIDEETGKLQQMIDDLLDTSRVQAGRLPLEQRPMALDELVESAVNKMRPGLQETGHDVKVRLPGEDVLVLADPMRVEQVLDNLLDNAARYSEPGTPVEVAIEPDDGDAVVSVTDRGDGIPETEHERIFEPFHRGENSGRRGVHGTGLGLAICRGIIEAQRGRIWVESVRGGGSTFRFALPLVDDDAGADRGR